MSILRRLSDSRFSEVLPAWRGATVVILGGGPSLTREQVGQVEYEHAHHRLKCIAVNDSYLLAPWADAHYAADSHWHAWHTDGVMKPYLGLSADRVREKWTSFKGEKCTIQNSGANVQDNAVHMLRNKHFPLHGAGLSRDPQALVTGRSSGFQAMNIASLAGAGVILLLGFDAREGQPKSHWHGGHPRSLPEAVHEHWRRHFTDAQKCFEEVGAVVINCSPGTAITAFQTMSLEQALSSLNQVAA